MDKRIEWIDTTKVFTLILVIIGHAGYYTIKTNYGGIDYFSAEQNNIGFFYKFINILIGFIYSFHMPLFMALSGMALRLSYNPNTKTKKHSQKRRKDYCYHSF